MKAKNSTADNGKATPEAALAALVINQLKGKTLFTEKIEEAKKYLKRLNETLQPDDEFSNYLRNRNSRRL